MSTPPTPQTLPFHTLDVFTQTRYAGNQLAIISLPSAPLSPSQKQSIAQEFNLSETIFVHPPTTTSPLEVPVDIFTTTSELPFAGHPTIGAVYFVLTQTQSTDEVRIRLKAGVVRGRLDRETGMASAEIPHAVRVHGKTYKWDDVVRVQTGLEGGAGAGTTGYPLVSIVRGLNFVLVELTAEAVGRVGAAADVAQPHDMDRGWREGLIGTVYYQRLENRGNVRRVDQRVVTMGIEDAATGSATCALCAWLAMEGYKTGDKGEGPGRYVFEVTQGVIMGRPSLIGVEVTLDGDGTGVKKIVLSGPSREVMKGELII